MSFLILLTKNILFFDDINAQLIKMLKAEMKDCEFDRILKKYEPRFDETYFDGKADGRAEGIAENELKITRNLVANGF